MKSNVAMRMRPTNDETVWEIAGRGELHLTILLENMRREGYELAVSRPRVVIKEVDGVKMEPMNFSRSTSKKNTRRRHGRARPAQGRPPGYGTRRQGPRTSRVPHSGPRLIGFQSLFMTMCRGTGIMSHVFDDYGPIKQGEVGERRSGVIISQDDGEAVAYALWKIQERGRLFVSPGDKLYEA